MKLHCGAFTHLKNKVQRDRMQILMVYHLNHMMDRMAKVEEIEDSLREKLQGKYSDEQLRKKIIIVKNLCSRR